MTKNSSWLVIGLGNKGPLKVLNGTKLTLDDHGNNLDSFTISLEFFRSFRGPLLHKLVTGQELFFAVSYSKPDLKTTLVCLCRPLDFSDQLEYNTKITNIVHWCGCWGRDWVPPGRPLSCHDLRRPTGHAIIIRNRASGTGSGWGDHPRFLHISSK